MKGYWDRDYGDRDCAIIYTEQGGMLILNVNDVVDIIGEGTLKVKRLCKGDTLLDGRTISSIIIENGLWDIERLLLGRCKERKIIVQLKLGEPGGSTYNLEMFQHREGISWTLISPGYDDCWNGIDDSLNSVASKVLSIMGYERNDSEITGVRPG